VVAQTIIPDGACKEKLVMIGPSGAGKTAIANRIIHDNFRPITAATVGASFQTKSFTVNSGTLRLDIWDTGGFEQYHALAPIYHREARAAIIVFDVTDRGSIVRARSWIEERKMHARKDIIVVAAANKTDIVEG
jgi:small GTP-binding protein